MSYKSNILTVNKKIYHNYHIKNTYLAGIVLEGWEVKGIKYGKIQIVNSYAIIKKQEIFLLGMLVNNINHNQDIDPLRTRKLLLNKNEIKKIIEIKQRNKISIVPIKCLLKNNLIKIEIGIVQGKKNYDKRHILKEKDWEKNKQRYIKIKNRG